jgi:uncharacterized membrane protein
MPVKARGTVRSSKAYAVFRIIFGLVFLGLGINQYQTGGAFSNVAAVSFFIAALFIGYGVIALVFRKKIGSSFEVETTTPTERLEELSKLRANGVITEAEYEAKRQEILKDI